MDSDYVVMKYTHQKDPVRYRYELQKISTGVCEISTVTTSETAPVEMMRRLEEKHERSMRNGK